MSKNLLKWPNLDSSELRIVLDERIGGPGQTDIARGGPNKFYLPSARDSCRVVLTFKGKKIVAIEPGKAFDATQWEEISNEIEHSILAGPTKFGREYSFSGRRVTGSWRGEQSGVQILPPPSDAPRAPMEIADHPFILEFPLMVTGLETVTNHRRLRKHRDLTLLLNVLLAGGTKSMGFRSPHFWAIIPTDHAYETKWVQQYFFDKLGAPVIKELSAPAAQQLEELEPEEYYVRLGHDGSGLRVPSDLDESICSYGALSTANRVKFDRAAFWFGTASRMWDISISASFAALVSAIESLTVRGTAHQIRCPTCGMSFPHEVPGPTQLFRDFLEMYAPGSTLAKDRNDMYERRSGIVHGSDLMELDQDIPVMGWTPPGFKEEELLRGLWRVTRMALRNWLKGPPPQPEIESPGTGLSVLWVRSLRFLRRGIG